MEARTLTLHGVQSQLVTPGNRFANLKLQCQLWLSQPTWCTIERDTSSGAECKVEGWTPNVRVATGRLSLLPQPAGHRLSHVCLGTSQATHPILCGSVPTWPMLSQVAWRHMGPPGGPPLAHGPARVPGVHGRAWALGQMANYLLAPASMAACGHALMTWHGKVCMARMAP